MCVRTYINKDVYILLLSALSVIVLFPFLNGVIFFNFFWYLSLVSFLKTFPLLFSSLKDVYLSGFFFLIVSFLFTILFPFHSFQSSLNAIHSFIHLFIHSFLLPFYALDTLHNSFFFHFVKSSFLPFLTAFHLLILSLFFFLKPWFFFLHFFSYFFFWSTFFFRQNESTTRKTDFFYGFYSLPFLWP